MLSILASYAQEESRSVSENCKWRIRESFEKGKTVGFYRMYGYSYQNGDITVNEEQAAVIRQIFEWYIGGDGSGRIAKRLNDRGVPAYHGGRWSPSRVADLIKNEKLTGNAILQKGFSTDHLTKKKKQNLGELQRWYVEDTHPQIISEDIFDKAAYIRAERAAHVKAGDTSANQYPYSGKIVCEHCGKHYRRKIVQGRRYWQCGTFLVEGRDVCPAQQIPERILDGFAAEFGGMDNIAEIRVPRRDRLKFILYDGREAEREWYISRRDSWTDEMRAVARARALKGGEWNA